MPGPTTQTDRDLRHEEILTLAEAATYLRVREEALAELADRRDIPGQKIGEEWRFLKRALADWLRYGPEAYREFRRFPHPLMFEYPLLEELLVVLEKRLLDKMAAPEREPQRPGSKQAVLKHAGIWRDDPVVKQEVAAMYGGESPEEDRE